MGKWPIVDFPPERKKEQAGRHFCWAEARRQEILCNVTMNTSSCISAIGIINLIMVVTVCPRDFLLGLLRLEWAYTWRKVIL